MCKTMKSLTVATYNVHMWCDKNHSETQDRMIELTKVICTVFENHSKYLIFKTSKRTKFIYRQIIFEFSRQNSIPKCILNETFTFFSNTVYMVFSVQKYKPDILCLQEATKRGLDTFVTKCGYAYFASYNSVAILSKLPMDFFP